MLPMYARRSSTESPIARWKSTHKPILCLLTGFTAASDDWKDVWIGAATTSLLFMVGKFLIGVYIGRSGIASGFGAAASLVVVLVWAYYSAQIFLLGAEFTRAYAHKFGSRKDRRSEDALVAVSPAAPSPNVNRGVEQ